MGLGDSLNSLAGGYARGQAQYAANEKTRQEQAQAAAKAAQDAAEFRLKLAQHDQTLMNSAETEWRGIMDTINSDSWTPALLPTILPRATNFDKTYGKIWKGGSATEMLQKALHLEPGGEMEPGVHGPPDPNATNPLMGFVSPEQKYAADERAMKSRSAEAARAFTVQAMDYVRDKSGGLPDEATFYRKIYDFQDAIMRTGEYDPKIIDEAMDIIRENAAGYYKGLANQLDQLSKKTTLSDAINSKIDEVGRQSSTWITSILQMDQQEGGLTGDLFAQRTPLRLKMEQYAQSMAEQGMPLGQIKTRIASRFSDEIGGLELDITKAPGMGALTFAGAPVEARNAVDRYFDLNMSPNEHRLETYWNPQTNEAWVVDPLSPQDSQRVWPPANQGTMPQGVAGTGQPTPVGSASAAVPSADDGGKRSGPRNLSMEELTPEERRAVEEYEKYVAGPARAIGRAVPSALEALFPSGAMSKNPFGPKDKK